MAEIEAQGVTFARLDTTVSPNTYNTVGEVSGFSGPTGSAQVIDTTSLADTAKQKRMGLPDEGQITLDIMFDPDDAQQTLLRTDRTSRTQRTFRLTFTNSPQTTWTFAGYVLGFEINGAVDDIVRGSITIEIDGAITVA